MKEIRIATGRIAAACIAGIAVLAIATVVAPQTSGPLALAQVFVLHLVLAGIVVGCLLALLLRTRAVAIALGVLLVVGAVRSGSELVSLPSGGGPGERIEVVSWNLELGARAAGEVAGPLLEHRADIVSLQELTPDAADALENDPAIRTRYPFRLLRPDSGTFGLGLLSAFPIVASAAFEAPVGLQATLELGQGRRLAILDAHPLPGRIGSGFLGLPMTFDGRQRDVAIEVVRGHIDDLTGAGTPFVVAGDFNTAPTEPAYARLADGLRDVHVEVGLGPGWTWRPSRLEPLGIGFLRIDLVLAGGGVRPAAIAVDCGHPGDHCIVHAAVVVP